MVMINYTTDVETLMTTPAPTTSRSCRSKGGDRSPPTSAREAGSSRPARASRVRTCSSTSRRCFYDGGLGGPVTHGFAAGPCVLKPTSTGSLTLRTASPTPSSARRSPRP